MKFKSIIQKQTRCKYYALCQSNFQHGLLVQSGLRKNILNACNHNNIIEFFLNMFTRKIIQVVITKN